MTVSNTNTVYDPNRQSRIVAGIEIGMAIGRNEARRRKSFKFRLEPTSTCSQCKRKMKKSMADAQIENGRDKAPICVPCILGKKRVPLSILKRRSGGAKNHQKFLEFCKARKEKAEKLKQLHV